MKMKIGILGAESTGKSTLGKQLAEHFDGIFVPEYAREYVEGLQRAYTYDDVCKIAEKQIEELQTDYDADYVFFDTELIITKVWFEDKYGRMPDWFADALNSVKPDFCLVCMPDLPFVYDPVRENPHRREELTRVYIKELQNAGIPFAEISGSERLKSAIEAIKKSANH